MEKRVNFYDDDDDAHKTFPQKNIPVKNHTSPLAETNAEFIAHIRLLNLKSISACTVMAQKFASYEAISKTESYDDENGAPVVTQQSSSSRRYVSILAALLAIVGTALLVSSNYSPSSSTVSQTIVKGTAFDSEASTTPKIIDLHSKSKVDSKGHPDKQTYNPTPEGFKGKL